MGRKIGAYRPLAAALGSISREEGFSVDTTKDQLLTQVFTALSRAQKLFGEDTPPVDPPVFAAHRDLEEGLGRGAF